ncbi:MAG: redoxin domain-containing protein [Bacillota bacterium]|jgi:peroxiredoxin|nr:redoxin domain-containing protein [Bacillota bacterium]
MDYPMREDLKIGAKFPNFELPDHNGEKHKLSQLLHGFPGVLIFSRGYFCPKDRRQMANYVQHLQPELRVNYTNLITVSVDDAMTTREVRDQLNANWTFLCDPERELLHDLEMVDTTDSVHGEIYIPYTFILDRDRTIYKIYNGWWFLGRPTVEEIRMDLRALMSQRSDWVYKPKA